MAIEEGANVALGEMGGVMDNKGTFDKVAEAWSPCMVDPEVHTVADKVSHDVGCVLFL